MKKVWKIVSFSLLMAICLVSSFGCSCSKSLTMNFNIVFSNEDQTLTTMVEMKSKMIVYKKFREPADSACYEKIDGNLVLIKDATGISNCYDKDGNAFEKAIYNNTDKKTINTQVINLEEKIDNINKDKNEEEKIKTLTQSVSDLEIPDEDNFGLLFEIEFESYELKDVYIADFDIYDLFGDIINENSINKVKMNYPDSYQIEDKVYYKIPGVSYFGSTNTLKFVIEIKGLNKEDLKVSENEITINLPIVLKQL